MHKPENTRKQWPAAKMNMAPIQKSSSLESCFWSVNSILNGGIDWGWEEYPLESLS